MYYKILCGLKLTTGCFGLCRSLVRTFRKGKSVLQMMLWCGRRLLRETDLRVMLYMMHAII